MDEAPNAAAQAVKESVRSLLDLLDQAMRTTGRSDYDEVKMELQQTVLKLIAGIVLSDKKFEEGEKTFIRALIDCKHTPGEEVYFLKQYGENWEQTRRTIPEFMKIAAVHDRKHKTKVAPAMLLELQMIGNNAGACDGNFAAVEHETVQSYLFMLANYLNEKSGVDAAAAEAKFPGWTSV